MGLGSNSLQGLRRIGCHAQWSGVRSSVPLRAAVAEKDGSAAEAVIVDEIEISA